MEGDCHDDEWDTGPSNEDFQTTCLIYEADPSVSTNYMIITTPTESFLERFGKQEQHTYPLGLATIEMPLLALRTAIFIQPELLQPNQYRFWSLQVATTEDNHTNASNSQHKSCQPPRLTLTFVYSETKTSESDSLEPEGGGAPMAVDVSLATAYPLTFPPSQEQPWLAWLNRQANKVLKEGMTSYAVCDYLDHYALDYFRVIHLDTEGYTLVLFEQPATWHGTHSVDSLVLDPLSVTNDAILMRHCSDGTRKPTSKAVLWPGSNSDNFDPSTSFQWLHPCILQHHQWFPHECPICFDSFVHSEMVTLDCRHKVCKDCFTMFVSIQVDDIQQYRRESPFRCPVAECRQNIRIMATVKPYLTNVKMDRVRAWIKDIKHPVCKLLPHCLDCSAQNSMRKEEIDGFAIACDRCSVRRCELCVYKLKKRGSGNANIAPVEQHLSECTGMETLKFARRYLRAAPEIKAQCEAKYSWIKTWAEVRVESIMAINEWLKEKEGQVCPVCSYGVVREVGCFHIHCHCGAHFCYECGVEIFPPFYGTHHCWEDR